MSADACKGMPNISINDVMVYLSTTPSCRTMFDAITNNLKYIEHFVKSHISNYIAHLCLNLQLIDPIHHQTANGTTPCRFVIVNTNTHNANNHLEFCQQKYELTANPFTLVNGTNLIGDAGIILNNNSVISCFCVKPVKLNVDVLKSETLTVMLASVYDAVDDLALIITRDSRMQIKTIQFPNFNLDDHPNLKSIIMQKIMGDFYMSQLGSAFELMNKLDFNHIKAASEKNNIGGNLEDNDDHN